MDTKRIAVFAGGTVAFVATVAAGAFSIVSLSPGEKRLVGTGQQAVLLEVPTAPRPFNSVTPTLPPAPPQGDLAEPERDDQSNTRGKPGKAPTSEAEPVRLPAAPAPASRRTDPPVKTEARPARSPEALQASPVAKPQPHAEGLLTATEIRRMRLSLRLTREQEAFWPPVEQALRELGAEQEALHRAGQDPKDAFGVGAGMRIYSVARPLLDVLTEDQKAQVRARARALGFGAIASSL